MEALSSLLVGRPFNILAVAVLFLAVHYFLRIAGIGPGRHPRALLGAATAWALYAVWEGVILVFSPEANIRVDLLVIWPVLFVLSGWFIIRAFRKKEG